jgi:hypothetical protein
LNLTFTKEDLFKILDDPKVQEELQEFERNYVAPFDTNSRDGGSNERSKKKTG